MRSKQDILDIIARITFNNLGLVPAIAQEATTGEVLMMAWMNKEAIEETLSSGRVCYWSRSRGELWRKGDSSGHIQMLRHFYIDCDSDSILVKVDQTGAACHTGQKTCFYTEV